MSSQYLIDEVFHVDGLPFEFIVTKDHQFILLNLIVKRDSFGYEEPLDFYRPINPRTGAKVYREVFKRAVNAIFAYNMKVFTFSIGMEKKRYPLYKKIAKRLETLGFDCYDLGGTFWCYKRVKD